MIWGTGLFVFDVAMFAVCFCRWVFLLIRDSDGWIRRAGIGSDYVFTPGGTGVCETIMIIFLSMWQAPAGFGDCWNNLTRATLLTGTIIFGYIYQHALIKYGKPDDSPGLALAILARSCQSNFDAFAGMVEVEGEVSSFKSYPPKYAFF